MESRSARNQDASPGAIGRSAVGARQEAGRRSASSGRRCAISPTGSARRLRAKSRPGRTVTVRVRFADLRSVTRSLTLPRADFGDGDPCRDRRGPGARRARQSPATRRPSRCWRSRCRISRSTPALQLELPLGLADEERRPGTQTGRGALGGRPRRRQDPRSLRMGGGRIRRRSRWESPAPFPTSSASSPRRSCSQLTLAQKCCAGYRCVASGVKPTSTRENRKREEGPWKC